MPTLYKSKIKYSAVIDGEAKNVTEVYLHEAINYTEVETQIPEILKTRINTFDEDTTDGINRYKINAVVWHAMQDEDAFFQVKVTMYFEKKVKSVYLVPAIDYKEAGERMEEYLKGSLAVYEITHVDKSDVMAFWHPNNELWQGDWHNRMDRYYSDGLYEAGHTDVTDDDDQQELDIVNDFRMKEPGEVVPGAKPASKKKVDKARKNSSGVSSVTISASSGNSVTIDQATFKEISNHGI